MTGRDAIFALVRELALVPSPPGREEAMDALLLERLGRHGAAERDAAGNIVLRIPGRNDGAPVALAAHKDEIGAVVKRVEQDGRLRLRPLGDAHPWIWGETPLVLLGDRAEVSGVLSFGARHVSKESPQREQLEDAPLRWHDTWVETKRSAAELA